MKINLNFAGCIRKGESPGEKLIKRLWWKAWCVIREEHNVMVVRLESQRKIKEVFLRGKIRFFTLHIEV